MKVEGDRMVELGKALSVALAFDDDQRLAGGAA
jgi:hypothetical protein